MNRKETTNERETRARQIMMTAKVGVRVRGEPGYQDSASSVSAGKCAS